MDGSHFPTPPGGGAVGHITELDALAAGSVLCLRLACEDPDAPARRDFLAETGAFGGQAALSAISALAGLCTVYGHRPLMRHAVTCSCFGGDEACFARLISTAHEGDRNDAMMLAMVLVSPDQATRAVMLAEAAGAALARLAVTPATRMH